MNAKAKGYILGSIAAASYGMNPLFALPLYKAGMDPDSVLFFRYLFAIPLLGIMIKARGRTFKIQRKETFPLIIMGLLVALSSLTLFLSYNYMAAGIASTLLFIYPIMVALIMAMVFKEKLALQTIVCMLLALGGIGLLYKSEDGSTLSLIGIAGFRFLPFLCHIHCGHQPDVIEKCSYTQSHLLCPSLRLIALRSTPTLFRSTEHTGPVVSVGQFACTGCLSHRHILPLHYWSHPIHRLHPDRYSRCIGTRDSHLLRNSCLWRKLDCQRKHRTGDDYCSRNARHRRGKHYRPTGSFQETVSKTPDKEQEKQLIL